jgi:WD40 repeat protein
MAPEQWEDSHRADARTDLYALGCTLFFLLVGRTPYSSQGYSTMGQKMRGHLFDSIPDLRAAREEVPGGLAAIYQKLLAKKPEERFQTARELAEALTPFLAGDPASIVIKPQRVGPKAPAPSASRGMSNTARWLVALAGGLAALALAGVVVIKITNKDGTTTTIEVPDNVQHVELSKNGKPIGRIALNADTPDQPSDESKGKSAISGVPLADLLTSSGYEWTAPERLPYIPGGSDAMNVSSVSGDGLSLVFAASTGKSHSDLWLRERSAVDAPFEKAMNLEETVNAESEDSFPTLSHDGLTLVFSSNRPGGSGAGRDMWIATRKARNQPFGHATTLPKPLNSGGTEHGGMFTADGLTFLFCSTRMGGLGSSDLWQSRRKDLQSPFSEPENLGTNVNSAFAEERPWVSPDGCVIVFGVHEDGAETDTGSKRKITGTGDLWIAVRATITTPFGPRQKFGPPISGDGIDNGFCSLTSDGKLLVFHSKRTDTGSPRDLWMSRRVPKGKGAASGAVDEAAQRKAVEWILAKGGEVAVRIAGKERLLKKGDSLPSEQFTIDKVWITAQKLTDQELLSLPPLAGLTELWLPGNYGLSGRAVPWLVQHPDLTALDLTNTKIGDDDLQSIVSALKKLRKIALTNTKVSPKGLKSLNDLPALRGVHTSSHFDPEAVAEWEWLRRATWFSGNDSWLSDGAIAELQKSETLRDLGFVDFSRPAADLKRLASLKGLKKLYLEFPKQWSAEHNQMLAEVPQLEEFRLGYGSIKPEWLKGLPDLPNLKVYNVVSSPGSRLSLADFEAVAKQHPKWSVFWSNHGQRILPNQGNGKTASTSSPAAATASLSSQANPSATPTLTTADGWLDCMPLIHLQRDVYPGGKNANWSLQDDAISMTSEAEQSLTLPLFAETSDIEIEVDITRLSDGKGFGLDIGEANQIFPIHFASSSTTYFLERTIFDDGKRALIRVRHQVRGDQRKLSLSVNNENRLGWQGRSEEKTAPFSKAAPKPGTIGLSFYDGGEFVIHGLRIKAHQGRVALEDFAPPTVKLPEFASLAALPGLLPRPETGETKARWQLHRKDPVSAWFCDWSKDGSQIAVAEKLGTVRIYDGDTRQLVRILTTEPGDFCNVRYQPTGRGLLVTSENPAQLFDIHSGQSKRIGEFGNSSYAGGLWNPDGKKLATHGHPGMRVWSETGQLLWSSPGRSDTIAWSRDGAKLFRNFDAQGRKFRTLDAETGQPIETKSPGLKGHMDVAHHRDLLAIARWANEAEHHVEIWDYSREETVARVTIKDRLHIPWGLTFSPDDELLAIGWQSAWIDVIDWKNNKVVRSEYVKNPIGRVPWNPKGTEIAYANGKPRFSILSLDDKVPTKHFGSYEKRGLALAPNQRSYMREAVKNSTKTIEVFAENGNRIFTTSGDFRFNWTPDGSAVLIQGTDGSKRLIDPVAGNTLRTFSEAPAALYVAAWSDDASILVGAYDKPSVHVWYPDGSKRLVIDTKSRVPSQLAVSPDKRMIAVAFHQSTDVELFDLEKGDSVAVLPHADGTIFVQLHWLSNERAAVAFGCPDGIPRVKVWDIPKRELVQEVRADHLIPRTSDRNNPWIPNMKLPHQLRSLDGRLQLILKDLDAPPSWDRLFVPDNGQEVSLHCTDEVIRTWNSQTGELLRLLVLLPNGQAITLDPTGKVLGKTAAADKELVAVVEQADGTQIMQGAEEFLRE